MALQINPQRILQYIKCPKKLSFNWDSLPLRPPNPPGSTEFKIIRYVIRQVYLEMARKGQVPVWRDISKMIDRATRELIRAQELTPEQVFVEARAIASRVLSWFQDVFPRYKFSGLMNVPIAVNLDGQIVYEDKIELMLIGGEKDEVLGPRGRGRSHDQAYGLILMDVAEGKQLGVQLYNDLEAQLHIWGAWKATDILPTRYVRVTVLPDRVSSVSNNVMMSTVQKTEGIVRQVARGIRDGVYYPVNGRECEMCPYTDRCGF